MSAKPPDERFRDLILPHLDSAFNLACWLTRNRDDAQDVVQEAVMRAFKFFAGFHGVDGRVWLLRIVRNTFYSWRKEAGGAAGASFDEDFHHPDDAAAGWPGRAPPDPEALAMQKDDDRLVRQALAALPLEFREVVVLRELEDLAYKEIAAIVDIPIGTVMSRLGRGRKLLATRLNGLYEET